MRHKLIRKTLAALLGPLPLLLCAACATTPVEPVNTRPPETRLAPVPAPTIPPATTPCAYDTTQMCNSDAETAQVIVAYDAALAQANRELCWLSVYFGYPACPTGHQP